MVCKIDLQIKISDRQV